MTLRELNISIQRTFPNAGLEFVPLVVPNIYVLFRAKSRTHIEVSTMFLLSATSQDIAMLVVPAIVELLTPSRSLSKIVRQFLEHE